MRVLLISHAYAAPINRQKLRALAGRPGLEVSALAPRVWKESARVFRTEPGSRDGYRMYAGDVCFPGRVTGHFYRNGLRRALRGAEPDLIHLEGEPWSAAAAQVVAAAALRWHRPRLVFFSWENLDLELSWHRRLVERAALARADLLIAGGETSRSRLIRRGVGPERIAVLPQFGLDPDLFHLPAPGGQPDVFTVGFVGRLVRLKGVDLLVRALGELGGEWRALLVGEGAMREALRALARSLGILDRIAFVDWVGHGEVPAFLRRMDVLVLPSRTTPGWAEQFGHLLIEAMGCGAVPVGSDSGEIPWVIGDAGLIFPEEDHRALAAALRRLRDEGGLREKLARAGRRRVLDHFSWEVIAEKTQAIYERVLQGGGGQGGGGG